MSDFLPVGYDEAKKKEEEKSSGDGYMRFVEGENRFRILTKPIAGWVWWVDANGDIVEKGSKPQKGNKPVRIDMETKFQVEQFENARLFWAMQVWNYNTEKAQILEITQVSIRDEIQSLIKDKDWGDPTQYDIVVTRTDAERTSYGVKPKPHKAFDAKGKDIPDVHLEALFDGGDPYKTDSVTTEQELDIDKLLKEDPSGDTTGE